MNKCSIAVVAALSFLIPMLHGQATTHAEKAEQIIRQNIAAFSENLVNRNYDAVVAAYTEDGKIFPSGLPILEGSDSLRQYWTPAESASSITVYHRVMPEAIKVEGKTAYDWGYYEGRSRKKDGTETPWRGKYVIVWKEVSPDEWKIFLDIWNRAP